MPALRFIEMLILYPKLLRGRGKFFREPDSGTEYPTDAATFQGETTRVSTPRPRLGVRRQRAVASMTDWIDTMISVAQSIAYVRCGLVVACRLPIVK